MGAVAVKQAEASLPSWAHSELSPASGPLWLQARREAAQTALVSTGLPTVHDEAWKYTSIAKLHQVDFARAQQVTADSLPECLQTSDYLAGSLPLVFVNGFFQPELSAKNLPAGLRVIRVAEALASDPALLEPYFATADLSGKPFAALNTLLAEDAVLVLIEKGATIEQPIHSVFLNDVGEQPLLASPRLLVVGGINSRATLVESYASTGTTDYLSNSVVEIHLAEAAGLEHYKIQNESNSTFHIGTLTVQQAAQSFFHSHVASLGSVLGRQDISLLLNGEGAECRVHGLYASHQYQHMDYHLQVDHLKPHTSSDLFFKGILDDQSRAVFNGKAIVREGASKADANQTNRNLLLSNEAEVDPKPELEIYHDDVKCSHGATVGQLQSDSLFYLQSRGIPLIDARKLLTMAFASEILAGMKLDTLRTYCEQQLAERLQG